MCPEFLTRLWEDAWFCLGAPQSAVCTRGVLPGVLTMSCDELFWMFPLCGQRSCRNDNLNSLTESVEADHQLALVSGGEHQKPRFGAGIGSLRSPNGRFSSIGGLVCDCQTNIGIHTDCSFQIQANYQNKYCVFALFTLALNHIEIYFTAQTESRQFSWYPVALDTLKQLNIGSLLWEYGVCI